MGGRCPSRTTTTALVEQVPKASLDTVDSPKHRALAHKQAQQSIVLLQNSVHKKTGKKLLPLKPTGQTIAMIGPNANARLNLLSGYHGTP